MLFISCSRRGSASLYLTPVLLNVIALSLTLQMIYHISILYFKVNTFDEQAFVICNKILDVFVPISACTVLLFLQKSW